MKATHLRGALLEYMVKRLLCNCGFLPVLPDDFYVFRSRGLLFVNGKGAAHDADVLMSPPIQMPFAYPSRLLFECKAYAGKTGLPAVRNALGLREDINNFEIVSMKTVSARRNNRRADYAIHDRQRFFYQIGVATVGEFTKPAVEFAANNKIPLLSLSWFLKQRAVEWFGAIDEQYVAEQDADQIKEAYDFLKGRGEYSDCQSEHPPQNLLEVPTLGEALTAFEEILTTTYVGLTEGGDIIFLSQRDEAPLPRDSMGAYRLKARLHYSTQEPDFWRLSIYRHSEDSAIGTLWFFLPDKMLELWRSASLDGLEALHIKRQFFSRIFLFRPNLGGSDMPFCVLEIDKEWLQQAETQCE